MSVRRSRRAGTWIVQRWRRGGELRSQPSRLEPAQRFGRRGGDDPRRTRLLGVERIEQPELRRLGEVLNSGQVERSARGATKRILDGGDRRGGRQRTASQ